MHKQSNRWGQLRNGEAESLGSVPLPLGCLVKLGRYCVCAFVSVVPNVILSHVENPPDE